MSVTLGSYTLPNPVESQESRIAVSQSWIMASGDEAWQFVKARRQWEYVWVAKGTDLQNIRAALEAAYGTAKSFVPWEGGGPYNVRVDPASVKQEPEELTGSGYWRISCTIRQVS
jgi:hypothetical protein